MKKNRGFTLIELMIVLAIVGIVASIAIPAAMNLGKGKHHEYSVEINSSPTAQKVEDVPNLDNCKALDDGNRTIYSCPDGKIYTK